jgi:hypothetical protein
MGVRVLDLGDVAEPARSAMTRLRGELPAIFGDGLLAIWLYGGQLQAGGSPGDLDGHVVLARDPTPGELARVRAVHQAVRSELGIQEMDVWYVVRSEAASAHAPRDVNWHEEARDENWALKRAHWFAGAYVLVFGLRPAEVVPRPDWAEVQVELVAQIERAGAEIERSPWLAMLSLRLCRVVRTLATREVVQSKLEAAQVLLPELSRAGIGLVPQAQQRFVAADRARRRRQALHEDGEGFERDRGEAHAARVRCVGEPSRDPEGEGEADGRAGRRPVARAVCLPNHGMSCSIGPPGRQSHPQR